MTEPSRTLVPESIHRDECVSLLGAAALARVVISVKCLPVALPARIALIEGNFVLLASSDPAVTLAAERGDVVSLQIDGLEADGHTWSVMASGIAKLATGQSPPNEIMRQALDRGATFVLLPLSVVVGQRG
ncbi:MAG: pyridoxamine 5'-phosphate oxidase family protein [Acidimicrobiales bacterium]|jgi:nitroimidazol reductase NimA-like FMN-containing flavoprotein (pyridoxamine 5'-phosphate oxidase superfamily)